MNVNLIDAGCGIGKTTALINIMNNDKSENKYIFITPFLSEVERVKNSCPDREFFSPIDLEGTKSQNLINLIQEEKNIVTTHALFKKMNIDRIPIDKLSKYILVMDEVADVIEELPLSPADIRLLNKKYITIDQETHLAKWKDTTYTGKFEDCMNMVVANNVYAYTDKNNNVIALMWLFPHQILNTFKDIFILTYMFDGQVQKFYFDYFGATYTKWWIDDFKLTKEPRIYDYSQTKKLIKICNKKSLNEIGENKTALSISWFKRNKNNEQMQTLQNNIRSFFRSYAKVNNNDVLWTTFKEYQKALKRWGYVTGFAPINSRATNEYGNKTAIAYIGNRFLRPTLKNFFVLSNSKMSKEFEDRFALAELVQFVYRSAIRNNKEVVVYIPSKRMRTLFMEWLKKPND